MKNKFEKFLLSLSGLFFLGLIVLGIKVQADQKKIALLTTNATANTQPDLGVPIQSAIQSARDSSLNTAAHSPITSATTITTTATVVPGKTITQSVPVVSKTTTTASKKTKTS